MKFQEQGYITADVYLDIRKPSFRIQNFLLADILHMPFRDRCFKTVFCSHVIEHLEEPLQGLKELWRVTGNYLEIRVPHRFWKFRDHNRRLPYGHKHHFSVSYFKTVFAGQLHTITITKYTPLIPFLLMSPYEIKVQVWRVKNES